ncbi:MAG TPA: glycogen debranching N-terminal domain-containing protein [Dermatophilaceae bacterium]|nr:glycogen debranching N-terminal domain-containing protein [Dermatophilaceae bacterium]
MTDAWTTTSSLLARDSGAQVTVIEGSSFSLGDRRGDIVPGGSQGLFVRDVRILSTWVMTVDGLVLEPLSTTQPDPFAASFLARAQAQDAAESGLLVERRRYVGHGMREDVVLRNLLSTPIDCQLAIEVQSDFADLFEVKAGQARQAIPSGPVAAGGDARVERPGDEHTSVVIRSSAQPGVDAGALMWHVSLPPLGRWETSLEVVPTVNGAQLALRHPAGMPVEHSVPAVQLREWREGSPLVRSSSPDVTRVLRRCVEDLGSLRIYDEAHPDRAVVAAGAPWFMALFGRDSLLTSWMVLPFDTSLASGTLHTLAEHQGKEVVAATEEEPGRILHETRFGPAARLALDGKSAYYGTADATPLFVMLVGELRRWGVGLDELRPLLGATDGALRWIERYGDADGDGFVEYARKTAGRLANQGWKDSWDGVSFADGRYAEPPIALAEVQGYVYAAYRARAQLAAELGDRATERRCADQAARLKERFNQAFWLEELGWFALALDGDKHPVDSLASNMGHCLWTGIVEEELAPKVAARLLSPEMFSGWGIRTLASSMAAYNPMSYHNGSVWPHDNALCAAGLMRYGFVDEATKVATAVFDAANHFDHRLPELFCGFSSTEFDRPIPYPTSCSPQAWASAAPLELLRTLLRLEPNAPSGQVNCAPVVPERYLPLFLGPIKVGPVSVSIDVDRDGWIARGSDQRALKVASGTVPVSH